MEYGKVPGVDKPLSRVGQGLMMISTDQGDKAFELLDAVYEAGVNFFDSSHIYGGGESDRAFGKWVGSRGLRDKIVLLDKCCHPNADRNRVTTFDLTCDLHDCLARLEFDYIDIFALHRDDESVPVGPIVEVLNEHLQAGKIRAFGGSNWTHQRIQEANEYAEAHGLAGFAVSSPHYSLAECYKVPWDGCLTITGQANQPARSWYEKTQLALLPWSSLSGGFLTGRFRRDNLDELTGYSEKLCIHGYCREENFRRLDRAEELAKQKGVTIPQIALAYVLCGPFNVFPLMAAYTSDQAHQNAASVEIKLTPQELAYLDLRSDTP